MPYFNGLLVVGVGVGIASSNFTLQPHGQLSLNGIILQAGAVLRPAGERWRVGFVAASGSTLHSNAPAHRLGCGDAAWGPRAVATGHGCRLQLRESDFESSHHLWRGTLHTGGAPGSLVDRLAVALDIVLEGGGAEAVSINAWASQVAEPARSDGSHGRTHGTAGFDLRLGQWETVGVGLAIEHGDGCGQRLCQLGAFPRHLALNTPSQRLLKLDLLEVQAFLQPRLCFDHRRHHHVPRHS